MLRTYRYVAYIQICCVYTDMLRIYRYVAYIQICCVHTDMLRTYKRKSLPPSYSKEDLNKAVENVGSGRMTLYRAAKLCKIPKAALFLTCEGNERGKKPNVGSTNCSPLP